MSDEREPADDQHGDASIVLYTQPYCGPCRLVEQYLVSRKLAFEVRDVTVDAAALATLEARGYLSTPVTRVGEQWIAGFRRDTFDRAITALSRR